MPLCRDECGVRQEGPWIVRAESGADHFVRLGRLPILQHHVLLLLQELLAGRQNQEADERPGPAGREEQAEEDLCQFGVAGGGQGQGRRYSSAHRALNKTHICEAYTYAAECVFLFHRSTQTKQQQEKIYLTFSIRSSNFNYINLYISSIGLEFFSPIACFILFFFTRQYYTIYSIPPFKITK